MAMGWQQMTELIARDVWRIECADAMITTERADKRWDALPLVGSNRRVDIEYLVGATLISLTKRGLLVDGAPTR